MQKQGKTHEGGVAKSYWTTEEWKSAQESNPDLVTIMLGTNDSKEINWPKGEEEARAQVFCEDFKDMIRICKEMPTKPKIWICIPPPLYEPYPFTMRKDVVNEILPKLISNIASECQVGLIDVSLAFFKAD